MQLKSVLRIVVIADVLLAVVQAVNVVDVSDYAQDCENGKSMISLDFSDLEGLEDDDGNQLLNGNLVFKGEYNDPIEVKVYSERFKQGTWSPGEISRDILNACPLLMTPTEPWYPFTSVMKLHECPFPGGHKEMFSMLVLGDVGMTFPDSFVGDWRLYVEVTTPRNGQKETECMRIAFSIKEI